MFNIIIKSKKLTILQPNRAADFMAVELSEKDILKISGILRPGDEVALPGGFSEAAALEAAIREYIEETRSGGDEFGRGKSQSAAVINLTVRSADFSKELKEKISSMIQIFNTKSTTDQGKFEEFPQDLEQQLQSIYTSKYKKTTDCIDKLHETVSQYLAQVKNPKLNTTLNDFLLRMVIDLLKQSAPFKDFRDFIQNNGVALETQEVLSDPRRANEAGNTTDTFGVFFDPENSLTEFLEPMGLAAHRGGDDASKAGSMRLTTLCNGGLVKISKDGEETKEVTSFCDHGSIAMEVLRNMVVIATAKPEPGVTRNLQDPAVREKFLRSVSASVRETALNSIELYKKYQEQYSALPELIKKVMSVPPQVTASSTLGRNLQSLLGGSAGSRGGRLR